MMESNYPLTLMIRCYLYLTRKQAIIIVSLQIINVHFLCYYNYSEYIFIIGGFARDMLFINYMLELEGKKDKAPQKMFSQLEGWGRGGGDCIASFRQMPIAV